MMQMDEKAQLQNGGGCEVRKVVLVVSWDVGALGGKTR